MSEARAVSKYIRIAPRKVRQVVDLIRGKKVKEALAILKFTPKRASTAVEKVVKSAAANAEHNLEMDKDMLYIAEAYVDQGPTLKRYNPRAMGRADLMRRRTSHITVVVKEQEILPEKEETAGKKKAGARKKAAGKTKPALKEDKEKKSGEKKTRSRKVTETQKAVNEPDGKKEREANEEKKATRKKKEG